MSPRDATAPRREQYRARVLIEALGPGHDPLVVEDATVELNYTYHGRMEVAIVSISGAADSVADSEPARDSDQAL